MCVIFRPVTLSVPLNSRSKNYSLKFNRIRYFPYDSFAESSKIQGTTFHDHPASESWRRAGVLSWHGFRITGYSAWIQVNFRRFYERAGRGHGRWDNGSTEARVDRNVLCKSNCLASRNAVSSSSDVFQSLKRRSNLPRVRRPVRCPSELHFY